LSQLSNSCGGYGNPLRRGPERVLSDVRNGYISPHQAKEYYGVVISSGMEIDYHATTNLRRRLEAQQSPQRQPVLSRQATPVT